MRAAAEDFTAEAPQQASRFNRTVHHLQNASPDEQADFTSVALFELAEVFMGEADLARGEAGQLDGDRRARLLGWAYAVDNYANQLLLVLDDVEEGFPVSLYPGVQGPANVIVAGRSVILGHPRADQQGAYEQRVLAGFCGVHDCQQMTAGDAGQAPIPLSISRASPVWTFTDAGAVCTSDDLEVHFRSGENVGALRGICEELVREVLALASDLSWQRRHGVKIDWNALALSATPGRTEHVVRLNGAGDSVLLSLPLLHTSPGLLADIKPWLFARTTGQTIAPTRLDAAKYGWMQAAG